MHFLNKKYFLLFSIVLISLICSIQSQEGEAKRPSARRPVGKPSKGTTTTAEPAEYDAEYPDGEGQEFNGEEGDEVVQQSSTTTEAPKKIGPVIRPFRSNDDFLNSLKRRQMDAKKHRAEKVAPKIRKVENTDEEEAAPAAPAPVALKNPKLAQANRRKFTKSGKPEAQSDDAAEEASEQQEKEEPKPKRPHPRLALRKRA